MPKDQGEDEEDFVSEEEFIRIYRSYLYTCLSDRRQYVQSQGNKKVEGVYLG